MLWFQVSNWINEKLQIALDESYRDPTNLQAKIQKHVAFDAEVSANRNRVDSVKEVSLVLYPWLHYPPIDDTVVYPAKGKKSTKFQQYNGYILAGSFIIGWNWSIGESHRPATSLWQIFLQQVVSHGFLIYFHIVIPFLSDTVRDWCAWNTKKYSDSMAKYYMDKYILVQFANFLHINVLRCTFPFSTWHLKVYDNFFFLKMKKISYTAISLYVLPRLSNIAGGTRTDWGEALCLRWYQETLRRVRT